MYVHVHTHTHTHTHTRAHTHTQTGRQTRTRARTHSHSFALRGLSCRTGCVVCCLGDQFVGRVGAGHHLDSADFGVLPPRFDDSFDTTPVLKVLFPNAPTSLQRVLSMLVASVVFHAESLKALLGEGHGIFSTPLFARGMVDSLRPHVVFGAEQSRSAMRSTGVPSSIAHIAKLQQVEGQVQRLSGAIAEMPTLIQKDVVDGVMRGLESRCVEGGTVTRDGLRELLREEVGRMGGIMEEKHAKSWARWFRCLSRDKGCGSCR